MRVLIMGGGVVGVTTAYQLLRDGHEVVLIERNQGVAQETSWGNAGMIAPGHSFVWSSPRAPWILLKSLFRKDQALRFRFSADPRLYSWSLKFLAECTDAKARANTLRKHRIAMYSQRVLHEVIAAETPEYDRNARGVLYFHRDQAALDAGVAHMQLLADDGQEIRVLDRAQVLALEPALHGAAQKIAGGIYCPTDETGDLHKFTHALSARCIELGAEFHTGTDDHRYRRVGRRDNGGARQRPGVQGRCLCDGAGQPQPLAVTQDRRRSAGLSDQGLFAHHSGRQPSGVADHRFGGRDEPGRHLAVRRPRAHHRHRGIRRLRHEPQACRLRLHEVGRAGAVSRWRRLSSRRDVGRSAADDARQPSDPWPQAPSQPLVQHRPRPYRLDHVARQRAHHRGSDRRTRSRRSRWATDGGGTDGRERDIHRPWRAALHAG